MLFSIYTHDHDHDHHHLARHPYVNPGLRLYSDFATNHISRMVYQTYADPPQSGRIDVCLAGFSPLADRSAFFSVGNSLSAFA
jgi:hypothetical protein